MFKKIVWATDGSDVADSAVPALTELALDAGSEIVVLHVDRRLRAGRIGGGAVPGEEDQILAKLAEQVADLCHAGIDATLQVETTDRPNIAGLIASVASELDADLVVVGTHGRTPMSAVAGSVAKALLHNAECPVLVVPLMGTTAAVEPRDQLVTS